MELTLNWPLAALIFGLVALLMFRADIGAKIRGITRAGKDGVSFERIQETPAHNPPLLSFVELMNENPVSKTVLTREKGSKTHLQSLNLKSDEEKISVLVRVLVDTGVKLEFNDISHTIFGSQLSLLAKLSSTSSPIQKNEVEPIFQKAKENYPNLYEEKSFDDWLRYLTASNLITIQDERIDITQYGQDFLKHLVDTRQAHHRYG